MPTQPVTCPAMAIPLFALRIPEFANTTAKIEGMTPKHQKEVITPIMPRTMDAIAKPSLPVRC